MAIRQLKSGNWNIRKMVDGRSYSITIDHKPTDREAERLIMRQIAEFVINDGAISVKELNEIDTDLWRRGVISLTAPVLSEEMQAMARILLKAA